MIEDCKDGNCYFHGMFDGITSLHYCKEHGFMNGSNSHLDCMGRTICDKCDTATMAVSVTNETYDKVSDLINENGACFALVLAGDTDV